MCRLTESWGVEKDLNLYSRLWPGSPFSCTECCHWDVEILYGGKHGLVSTPVCKTYMWICIYACIYYVCTLTLQATYTGEVPAEIGPGHAPVALYCDKYQIFHHLQFDFCVCLNILATFAVLNLTNRCPTGKYGKVCWGTCGSLNNTLMCHTSLTRHWGKYGTLWTEWGIGQ